MAQLDDIVSKQQIDNVIEIDKAINALFGSYTKLSDAVGKNNAAAGKVNSYQELNAVMKETADQAKKLGEAEKQSEKIAKDQAAAIASLEKQRQAAYATMAKQEAKEKEMAAAINMEVKSIKDAELQNKALTEAKKKLNLTTEEGKKKNEQYNQAINKNTEFIRQNADAATKQRMNIGNYKSALEGMPGALGKVGNSMTGLDRVMKIIAATNPFTLILVAVTALISILAKLWSSTDSGGTKMKALFEGFKAVFDVLIRSVADFVGGLVKIFSGKFKEGAEQMGNAFKGIGEQMQNAAKAAHDYEMAMDNIQDLHKSFISDEAKLRREIAELEFIAQDQTKTMAEREAALKSALSKEQELVDFRKTEAVKSYDLLIAKVAAMSGNTEEFVRGLIDMNAQQVQALRETSPEVGKFYDLYEDEIEKLEESFASVQKVEQDYFEQNKRNISKLTGFQEQYRKQQEEAAKKQAEIDAVAADRLFTISTVTALDADQVITDNHIAQLELREQADIDFTEREIERTEAIKEAKMKAANEYLNAASAYGTQLFDINQMLIDAEVTKMEQAKAYELQLAGDNAAKREEIEKKYDKEATKLKQKQARQDKAQALFTAIIKTAQAVLAGLAYGPPLGYVFAALNAVLGAVQVGIIASQPIPQFFKGTESAPDGVISVAEKGQELIKTRSGKVLLATQPTLLSGMKGAQIYSNPETELLLKHRNVGYDSPELRRTLEKNNRDLIRTIENKREIHITPPKGSRISERTGNYYKNYWTRKLG